MSVKRIKHLLGNVAEKCDPIISIRLLLCFLDLLSFFVIIIVLSCF